MKQNELGLFSLPLLVVSFALFASTLFIQKSTARIALELSSTKNKTRAEAQTKKTLLKATSLLQSAPLPLLVVKTLPEIAFFEPSPHLLQISSFSPTGRVRQVSSSLLSLKRKASKPPHPNWHLFVKKLLLQKDPCKNWELTSGDEKNIRSLWSCTLSQTILSSGALFRGNVNTPAPLLLENASNTAVSLVVIGELVLPELKIRSSSSTSIEILTAGNLEIKKIALEDSSNICFRLYSAHGEIKVPAPQMPECISLLDRNYWPGIVALSDL